MKKVLIGITGLGLLGGLILIDLYARKKCGKKLNEMLGNPETGKAQPDDITDDKKLDEKKDEIINKYYDDEDEDDDLYDDFDNDEEDHDEDSNNYDDDEDEVDDANVDFDYLMSHLVECDEDEEDDINDKEIFNTDMEDDGLSEEQKRDTLLVTYHLLQKAPDLVLDIKDSELYNYDEKVSLPTHDISKFMFVLNDINNKLYGYTVTDDEITKTPDEILSGKLITPKSNNKNKNNEFLDKMNSNIDYDYVVCDDGECVCILLSTVLENRNLYKKGDKLDIDYEVYNFN